MSGSTSCPQRPRPPCPGDYSHGLRGLGILPRERRWRIDRACFWSRFGSKRAGCTALLDEGVNVAGRNAIAGSRRARRNRCQIPFFSLPAGARFPARRDERPRHLLPNCGPTRQKNIGDTDVFLTPTSSRVPALGRVAPHQARIITAAPTPRPGCALPRCGGRGRPEILLVVPAEGPSLLSPRMPCPICGRTP